MSEIRVDTISEKTSANGVAIDGVTIKDGGITATTQLDVQQSTTDMVGLSILNTNNSATTTSSQLRIGMTNSVGASYAVMKVQEGGSDDYPDIIFGVQNAATTTPTERMRIKDTGQVGIGTASPTKALGIGGTGDISLEGSSNAIAFYDSAALKAYITSQSFGDHNGDGLGLVTSSAEPIKFFTNGSERMKIDSTGAVTMPLQPAFLASPAAEQTNLTNSTTLLFGTEVTDRNADYNAGTGTFTAPVTGLYQVGFSIRLQEVPIDATYVMVETVSSNRSFYYILDPGSFDENAAYWEFNGNYLIDMDANDTYFIRYIQSGGTTSTDMSTASYSFGTLAC